MWHGVNISFDLGNIFHIGGRKKGADRKIMTKKRSLKGTQSYTKRF